MSIPGLALGLTALEAGGLVLLQSFNSRIPRNIGGIVAHVTIEEEHVDKFAITDHPVEMGSNITDHAYRLPTTVTIRCGWSNSPPPKGTGLLDIPGNLIGGLAATAAAFAGPSSYVQQVYDDLLALQAALVPLTIVTGKRTYDNMLIESLAVTTNRDNENALQVVATCRRVMFVQTTTVQIPTKDVQKSPQDTMPVENMGAKQLAPHELGFR